MPTANALILVSFIGCSLLVASLRILPETPTDFSIQLCTHQRRYTHGHMQFFPQPVKYCASFRSSKSKRELSKDLQGSTSHYSEVLFTWRQVTSARKCSVTFKGYQSEYRISPDFGAYESCQFPLSKHIHALSEAMIGGGPDSPSFSFNSSNTDCPIEQLPTSYADYVSCSLMQNEWYILTWRSTIRYETFQDGSYGTYWANYTTSYVFQPTAEISRNGSETEWMSRLVEIDSRSESCDTATLLIRLEPHWPLPAVVTLTYRIREGVTKIYSSHMGSLPVERWLEHRFPLHPMKGYHEACIHMSHVAGVVLRQRICRIVVDPLDCPFEPTSSGIREKSSIVMFLVFLFSF